LIVAQFHFDAESHTYTVDGTRLPSVTQLLKPIAPDFSMVPPDVLEAKRALGVVVHEACQYDDEDDLDDESVPQQVEPYLAAWRKFKAETGALILMNEQKMFHPVLRYAGTVDRLATIRGDVWMLDIKTSADPYPSYGAQLSGYVELHRANYGDARGPLRRATVHLRDDGTYRLHEFKNPNDSAAFMACLSLYQWKEMNK
jgi:hypothetical protein